MHACLHPSLFAKAFTMVMIYTNTRPPFNRTNPQWDGSAVLPSLNFSLIFSCYDCLFSFFALVEPTINFNLW